jgi:hypothetical protein
MLASLELSLSTLLLQRKCLTWAANINVCKLHRPIGNVHIDCMNVFDKAVCIYKECTVTKETTAIKGLVLKRG